MRAGARVVHLDKRQAVMAASHPSPQWADTMPTSALSTAKHGRRDRETEPGLAVQEPAVFRQRVSHVGPAAVIEDVELRLWQVNWVPYVLAGGARDRTSKTRNSHFESSRLMVCKLRLIPMGFASESGLP